MTGEDEAPGEVVLELAPGFYVGEDRCWRMARSGVGHPSHSPEAAGWTGRYVNPKGKRWTVWSCQEHLEELENVRPWTNRTMGRGSPEDCDSKPN